MTHAGERPPVTPRLPWATVPPQHRGLDPRGGQRFPVHQRPVEHHQVGALAGLQRATLLRAARDLCGGAGEERDRLVQREPLLGLVDAPPRSVRAIAERIPASGSKETAG